ncbi:MAG TPA: BrnT family toxin [Candidatus Hydrogenedentes bacterium]|nr:BrnT family toxin [Candidatus Hydrogenedentota bacterium]
MSRFRFTWDPRKARTNERKHGITFEEAQSVFYDENAIEFYDNEHSEWEDRFLLLGTSSKLRLLMICHCFREADGVIRIVSARKATQRESVHYRRK